MKGLQISDKFPNFYFNALLIKLESKFFTCTNTPVKNLDSSSIR